MIQQNLLLNMIRQVNFTEFRFKKDIMIFNKIVIFPMIFLVMKEIFSFKSSIFLVCPCDSVALFLFLLFLLDLLDFYKLKSISLILFYTWYGVRMCLIVFLFKIFLVKVLSLKIFLEELPISVYSENVTSDFYFF